MNHKMIRRVIEKTFKNANDLLKDVKLVREVVGAHTPGEMPVLSDTEHPVQLFQLPPRRTKAGMETGPVINKGIRVSLILSRDIEPEPGDRLKIGNKEFCIEQVGSMDHGAGLLYEVWYQ